jgi:hypothetical protein
MCINGSPCREKLRLGSDPYRENPPKFPAVPPRRPAKPAETRRNPPDGGKDGSKMEAPDIVVLLVKTYLFAFRLILMIHRFHKSDGLKGLSSRKQTLICENQ